MADFIVSETDLTDEEIRQTVPSAKNWVRVDGGYRVQLEDGKGAGNGTNER